MSSPFRTCMFIVQFPCSRPTMNEIPSFRNFFFTLIIVCGLCHPTSNDITVRHTVHNIGNVSFHDLSLHRFPSVPTYQLMCQLLSVCFALTINLHFRACTCSSHSKLILSAASMRIRPSIYSLEFVVCVKLKKNKKHVRTVQFTFLT
jgi:hypothetical protein